MNIKNPNKVNFPDISINAAEELAKFSKNPETKLNNVKELSELILTREFSDSSKYYYSFIGAYHEVYSENSLDEIKQNPKTYLLETYQKLIYHKYLEKDERSRLINFCAKLGAYVGANEVAELRNREPCF